MKNTIKRIILGLLFIGIYSCDKEGQIETNQDANDENLIVANYTTKYFLDDSAISKVEFESLRENDDIITHSHYADNNNGESYLQERAYTSSNLYYSWGDQLDLKLREADAYAKEMADFAETSGAIKHMRKRVKYLYRLLVLATKNIFPTLEKSQMKQKEAHL